MYIHSRIYPRSIKDAHWNLRSTWHTRYDGAESYLVYQYSYRDRHETFVDVLLNLRTLRNRYAAGAADIYLVAPVGLRCSMFSKGTSNQGNVVPARRIWYVRNVWIFPLQSKKPRLINHSLYVSYRRMVVEMLQCLTNDEKERDREYRLWQIQFFCLNRRLYPRRKISRCNNSKHRMA